MKNWRQIFSDWEHPEFQVGDEVTLKEPDPYAPGKGRITKVHYPGSYAYKQLVNKIGFPGEPAIVYSVMFTDHPVKPTYLFFEHELVKAELV